jgi:hypothetical protein
VPDEMDEIAKFNRSYMYHRVRDLDDLKMLMWQKGGATISVPIHPGWRGTSDGVIEIPSAFPKPTEYHAVSVLGYDDDTPAHTFH